MNPRRIEKPMPQEPERNGGLSWDESEIARAVDSPWVILFGGRGRQRICRALVDSGINIGQVLFPRALLETASDAIEELQALGIPVMPVVRSDFAARLSRWDGHPVMSVGFPYLIGEEILARHPLCLNVHPTLLPKYKGPHSGAHVILNGEIVSGSTVHLMSEAMDSGAIVAQRSVPLSTFDTVRSMQRKIYDIEPGLVLEAIDFLRSGGIPLAQDLEDETVFPGLRTPADSLIDSRLPLKTLWNAIRACDPDSYPAHFFIDGEKVCIRLWRPNKNLDEHDMI